MQLVGYKLIKIDDNTVLKEWGGIWGQSISKPEVIDCPNGDTVCAPQVDTEYSGCKLIEWFIDDPAPPGLSILDIVEERNRRLSLGFDYNFNDERGIHHIGTTEDDMKGWDEVTTWATAQVALDKTDSINILTNTGAATITALEWMRILEAASAFRQLLWQYSFVLQSMDLIPSDYKDDKWWSVT